MNFQKNRSKLSINNDVESEKLVLVGLLTFPFRLSPWRFIFRLVFIFVSLTSFDILKIGYDWIPYRRSYNPPRHNMNSQWTPILFRETRGKTNVCGFGLSEETLPDSFKECILQIVLTVSGVCTLSDVYEMTIKHKCSIVPCYTNNV